ncbi:MAG: hypothetical protein AB8B85_02735 [Paracoccaceae bacterium]
MSEPRPESLEALTGADCFGYAGLPVPIQMIYTPKEWMWLTDEQRATAQDDACTPETYPED